ncbi:ATP-binding cassette domain-containing protein [Corynebacterium sp. HS2168-gen11]|nr:ATP-binding cassette domain-containing protein [Corynebacterium sp. HS2168-gen11]MCS4535504.1 ATP-binding cassette domain-containing protein [Corynebacterium sp. HS2168-gen11]
MCTTIIGAGHIIDAYPQWPSLAPIIVGPIIIVIALVMRAILEARGIFHEESLIRHRLIHSVFAAGPARTSTTQTGAVVSLATESSEKMMAFRVGFVAQVIASLTAPLVVLATVALSISFKIAVILALMLPIVPLLIGGFRKVVSKVSSGSQDARKALAAAYMDALRSLGTLQLLGAAGRIADDLEEKGEENRVAVMQLLRGNQFILFVMDSAFSLALVAVAAWLALSNVAAGTLSPGQGIALLGLSMLLLEPMDQVGAFFYVGMSGLGGQRGIFGFLRSHTEPQYPPAGTATTDAVVSVDNLSFNYEDQAVFTDASLQIRQGERVAIMGRSGEGKSTLLSLLKGDLLPSTGSVIVAGKQGKELPLASASVAQTTWLFSGTIADNLRIAAPDATEEQMWDALERARVADEIRRMPLGLETELGEQGLGISGGQAQRISLARAIISGRTVILLDEPTSHVDLTSEREILAAIDALGPEYTLIMVTHRMSSLTHMDRIVTVENGRIKETA